MMKPTIFIVIMMEETVAPLKILLSKQIGALNVIAIAKILNLLVMDIVMMQQTTQSATMMVETVVGLAYPVILFIHHAFTSSPNLFITVSGLYFYVKFDKGNSNTLSSIL